MTQTAQANLDPQSAECPRCGYDLRGAVGSWPADRCPSEGICSECGLTLLWRDVLNPAFATSDRFFETAQRRLGRAFVGTWGMSLRPWCLWRVAQMQFPVRAGRTIGFVILSVTILWVAGALLHFGNAIWNLGNGGGRVVWLRELISAATGSLWPIAPTWWSWRPYRLSEWLPSWLVLGWLWLLVTPATFRLVPQTLRRARVRRSHLVRIWAYSLVGLPLLMYVPTLIEGLSWHVTWLHQAVLLVFDNRGVGALTILVLWGGWIGACWSAAARHYLRLERPRTVAIVLVVLGGLMIVTLALVAACVWKGATEWMMSELG